MYTNLNYEHGLSKMTSEGTQTVIAVLDEHTNAITMTAALSLQRASRLLSTISLHANAHFLHKKSSPAQKHACYDGTFLWNLCLPR
jgi:hypothetical protein